MCCFSGPVERVEATRIFARLTAPGRQVLVYEMKMAAAAEVAMILPIPVVAGAGEDALRFVSLEEYPEFFDHLVRVFPAPAARSAPSPGTVFLTLEVVRVGAFEASFVPSLADFGRLDPRFRLPEGTLDRVPEYADWGFAVFQLAATAGELKPVHPMAFEFPTRADDALFFPTVHVHDGVLHEEATFAHNLLAQGMAPAPSWWLSPFPAGKAVDLDRARGLVDGDAPVSMTSLLGVHPNRDVWAPLGKATPEGTNPR